MNFVELRHKLHQHPELSNNEVSTAYQLVNYLTPLSPDQVITGIGGAGVAVCFGDAATGSTVMLRCELDALPISETNTFDHRSKTTGISHKCGHDGHMAILAAVAQYYSNNRPKAGRVILLFQPAEETGEGAKKVLEDKVSEQLNPDFVFALHNAPKYPLGEVLIKTGTICCGSRGMVIRLTGKTAHAAQPETGNSPVKAVYQLLPLFEQLPALINSQSDVTFATIVGVKLGEKTFGTSPSDAEIYVTLRSEHDIEMKRLVEIVSDKIIELAKAHKLTYSIEYEDVYYWEEIKTILSDARKNIPSTLGLCWAGFVMAYLEGVKKLNYDHKLFGVFELKNLAPDHPIMGELDDVFFCPQSRHAGMPDEAMEEASESGRLKLLAYGPEAGYSIFSTTDDRFIAHTGHPEYNANRLAEEAKRDLGNPEVPAPVNFDFNNPLNRWRSHRNIFFAQWVSYCYLKISTHDMAVGKNLIASNTV